MYKRVLSASLLCLLWLGGPVELTPTVRAHTDDDAQALLAKADGVRNPDQSFAATTTLAEYREGKLVDSSVLVIYSQPMKESGQYNTLVRFMSPKRDAGKLVLRNGMDMWFYDPSSKASIRISPQARLLGQASNGDVMSTNLAKAYDASFVAHEQVADDKKTLRLCTKLRLQRRRPDVPYAAIDYWVDEATGRPLKAQFFTAEGRLLKTAIFRHYQAVLDQERPLETVIIDGLDPAWITVIRSSNFQWREIQQSWLQRDYLPRFTSDE